MQVAQTIPQTILLVLREWGGMERDNLATLQLLSQAEQPNSALAFFRLECRRGRWFLWERIQVGTCAVVKQQMRSLLPVVFAPA